MQSERKYRLIISTVVSYIDSITFFGDLIINEYSNILIYFINVCELLIVVIVIDLLILLLSMI